jgi:two-component system, NtrC family, sensor kinase
MCGGQLNFHTFVKEDFCRIEIIDNGEGIDQKVLSKIFDPFFTTKEKGVGLGLSIAHKIVSQHGGILSVTSNIGKTVFFLELPLI